MREIAGRPQPVGNSFYTVASCLVCFPVDPGPVIGVREGWEIVRVAVEEGAAGLGPLRGLDRTPSPSFGSGQPAAALRALFIAGQR